MKNIPSRHLSLAFICLSVSILFTSCQNESEKQQKEAQSFLDQYNNKYRELYTASSAGQWAVNTHIVEGDTMNAYNSSKAEEAMAAYTGSLENINKATELLKFEKNLTDIQVKQLKKVLYLAAANPESESEKVKELIKAATAQTEALYGYKFMMNGKEVTPNDIDSMLAEVKDTIARRIAWESSKEVGTKLKPGLIKLRELRNKVVQGLGYPDYFNF